MSSCLSRPTIPCCVPKTVGCGYWAAAHSPNGSEKGFASSLPYCIPGKSHGILCSSKHGVWVLLLCAITFMTIVEETPADDRHKNTWERGPDYQVILKENRKNGSKIETLFQIWKHQSWLQQAMQGCTTRGSWTDHRPCERIIYWTLGATPVPY